MISLFSGTPGSGKSLHTADIIYRRCSQEKITLGNFEINRDVCKGSEFFIYVDNDDLTPSFLYDFSNDYFNVQGHKFHEDSIMLIIDECQLLFNVREWNLKGRQTWIKFFTQHRKLGYEIILVAQFDKMIDKQVRSLLEYEFVHRKMSNFGWRGKMISMWTGNRLFIAVQRWYPIKERIGAEHFLYSKKLGALYDTRMLFEKPSVNVEKLKKINDDLDIEFIETGVIDDEQRRKRS